MIVFSYQSRGTRSIYSQGGMSHGGLSTATTVKTKTSRVGKMEIETMTAPHPFCPNTKGMCCLMVLLNLGLLLVTLGFIVVLQLRDPAFVW